MLIRHGEAGRQGLLWLSRPSCRFSKVLDRHALSRGLAMTSLWKTAKLQDTLKVFEIGIISPSPYTAPMSHQVTQRNQRHSHRREHVNWWVGWSSYASPQGLLPW